MLCPTDIAGELTKSKHSFLAQSRARLTKRLFWFCFFFSLKWGPVPGNHKRSLHVSPREDPSCTRYSVQHRGLLRFPRQEYSEVSVLSSGRGMFCTAAKNKSRKPK